MNGPMTPYGLALRAYFEGQTGAKLRIRRDDGFETKIPVEHFFRGEAEFGSIETSALERCRGHVLDAGAGTGVHSLALQSRGVPVTAVDIDPHAVAIMTRRGVREVRRADVLVYDGGSFDTLLMLGHGIGIVGDLEGLGAFLEHAHCLVRPGGRILFDSLDVTRTDNPVNLAYHEANRRAGKYVGEIRIQFEYEESTGPMCGWLHVDSRTLAEHADRAGWTCEIVVEEESGDYLARLRRRRWSN